MDRNTFIGFVLIGLVVFLWLWLNSPTPQPPATRIDTSAARHNVTTKDTVSQSPRVPRSTLTAKDTLGQYFSPLLKGKIKTFSVETNYYRADITTQGGAIHSWVLTQYKTWNGYPVNLINTSSGGDLHLIFYSSDGKLIDTRNLIFQTNIPSGKTLTLSDDDSLSVPLVLRVDEHSRIVKTLIFHGNSYSLDVEYEFEGMENVISNFEYQIAWESGVRYAEQNSVNESNYAAAYALSGGELTEIDASKFDEVAKQNISGRVAWVATRNKYFAVAIIPHGKESQGAYLEGTRVKLPNEGVKENYSMSVRMPFVGRSDEIDRFTLFLGPLDFGIVKQLKVGLDRVMSLGAAWIIRPISEYVIIPLFQFLRYFIPNYGIILIVFSIIVKVVLYPLTKSSMRSMQKMQALQPMMEEIRAKYKNDPQKMNQQVMRLYKEYGVNPAGGCLPLLLQLPILYALWAVFGSAIELRQASFVWWIHDLSVPDVVLTLPFRLPIFNINEISGLALLMGVTMFIQQKMSVKDPRQKTMVWLMPVLLTLMFNNFPSGLNLYYFVFNLLSIGQQMWINKQHKNEPLRKVEEKRKAGGVIGKLSSNLKGVKK